MMERETFFSGQPVIDRKLGSSFPLGATVLEDGVNFSVFSKNADAIELLLFDNAEDPGPTRTILLDPKKNRTYHYWHAHVPDIGQGQIYGYRAHGSYEPERGMCSTLGRCSLILTAGLLSCLRSIAANWREILGTIAVLQ